MSPHDRFIRRVCALGGRQLRRGEERRFVVESDGDRIRVLDDPDNLPIIEVGFGVATRRDWFPEGLDDDRVRAAMRAAKQLLKVNVNG